MSWASQLGNGDLSGLGNSLSDVASVGVPGHNNFQGTTFQAGAGSGYDPNAFQGQWNDPNSAYNPNNLAQGAGLAQGRSAPGLQGQYGMSGFDQSQMGQGSLAQLLMGQATGQGPSMAQEQLKNATQTNVANSMALSAANRGNNPAMAGYQAAQQAGNLNQQAAGQGVQAGISERLGAMGQLGNVYGQMGGQALQAGGMGLQAQGQQRALNDRMTQYFLSQGMSAEQAQQQASIAQQGILSNSWNQVQGLNAGVAQGNAQAGANFTGGLLGAAGSIGGSIMNSTSIPGLASGGVTGDAAGKGFFQGLGVLGASIAGQPLPEAKQDGKDDSKGGSKGGLGSMLGGGGGGAAGGESMLGSSVGAGDILGAGEAGSAAGIADVLPLVALADKGTVVPGVDHGADTHPYMLRPNEVVTPPENPLHPWIKAAELDPGYASALAYHLSRSGIQAPTGPATGVGRTLMTMGRHVVDAMTRPKPVLNPENAQSAGVGG